MNVKKIFINITIGLFFTAGLLAVAGRLISIYQSGSGRAGEYTERERQLLDQLGEYQQREAARIERERKRFEETDSNLAELRKLDRRSGDLYALIRAEIKILQDDYDNRKRDFNSSDPDNSGNSEE